MAGQAMAQTYLKVSLMKADGDVASSTSVVVCSDFI